MITLKKLSKGRLKSLSERLKDEQDAYRMYRYFANCLRNKGFLKAAAYYEAEAMDELTHAHTLEKYATDWNCELDFLPLDVPKETEGSEAEKFVGIIEASYKFELYLLGEYTKDINECMEEGDMSTFNFLQQFIDIQTKAVAEYAEMINILALFDMKDTTWLLNFEKKIFG